MNWLAPRSQQKWSSQQTYLTLSASTFNIHSWSGFACSPSEGRCWRGGEGKNTAAARDGRSKLVSTCKTQYLTWSRSEWHIPKLSYPCSLPCSPLLSDLLKLLLLLLLLKQQTKHYNNSLSPTVHPPSDSSSTHWMTSSKLSNSLWNPSNFSFFIQGWILSCQHFMMPVMITAQSLLHPKSIWIQG